MRWVILSGKKLAKRATMRPAHGGIAAARNPALAPAKAAAPSGTLLPAVAKQAVTNSNMEIFIDYLVPHCYTHFTPAT